MKLINTNTKSTVSVDDAVGEQLLDEGGWQKVGGRRPAPGKAKASAKAETDDGTDTGSGTADSAE